MFNSAIATVSRQVLSTTSLISLAYNVRAAVVEPVTFFVPDLGPIVTVYVPDATAFEGTVTVMSLSVNGKTLPFASLIVKSLAVTVTALLSTDADFALTVTVHLLRSRATTLYFPSTLVVNVPE